MGNPVKERRLIRRPWQEKVAIIALYLFFSCIVFTLTPGADNWSIICTTYRCFYRLFFDLKTSWWLRVNERWLRWKSWKIFFQKLFSVSKFLTIFFDKKNQVFSLREKTKKKTFLSQERKSISPRAQNFDFSFKRLTKLFKLKDSRDDERLLKEH